MAEKSLKALYPELRRIIANDLNSVVSAARRYISRATQISEYSINYIETYHYKASHGDIDFMIPNITSYNIANIGALISILERDKIPHTSNYTEHAQVVSFVYAHTQINLIFAKAYMMPGFFSFGDIGNLFAVLANAMGMVLDPTGLYIKAGNSKITVTQEWAYIQAIIMGDTSSIGSRQLTDIFRRVSNTKYFNKELFPRGLEIPLNEISVLRGVNHNGFKAFIHDNQNNTVAFDYNSTKRPWLETIKRHVGDVIGPAKKIIQLEVLNDQVSSKFTEEKVKELLGDPDLNFKVFAEDFKDSFKSSRDFEMFIRTSMPGTINERIKAHHHQTISRANVPVLEKIAKSEKEAESNPDTPEGDDLKYGDLKSILKTKKAVGFNTANYYTYPSMSTNTSNPTVILTS